MCCHTGCCNCGHDYLENGAAVNLVITVTMFRKSTSTALIIVAALLLSGCGAINSSLSEAVTDSIPHWAGGLPADAPPRVTDPKYAEYLEKLKAKAMAEPPKADVAAETKPELVDTTAAPQ
jgi:ABC-type glycerol-3-phosphate transport system substrate-binding protein